MTRRVRVRFAPSPTGPLHPGGVRTALFNYLFARKNEGDFILRIEDTDQKRFVAGAEDFIIESLSWCGIEFDEGPHKGGAYGPYRQSERKNNYAAYAEQLVENGHAYYAFDTAEELDDMREKLKKSMVASPQYNSISRVNMKNSLTLPSDEVERRLSSGEPWVIRFKMPRNEEVKLKDLVRGWVSFNTNQLDDKILMKSDGMPTYHMANVVDDHLMEISHVIRGEEWLPSAPLHVLLYKGLGWEETMPEFAHLSLLLKPDGKGKLSKRDGDKLGLPFYAIDWVDPATGQKTSGLRESGYLAPAYVNFLSLLGWNPGDNRELFELHELVEAFSTERINKSGARYDFDKLNWFNQQYLKELSDEALATMLEPVLQREGIEAESSYTTSVCRLMKDRWTTVNDFWPGSAYFYRDPEDYNEKVARKKWKEPAPAIIESFVGKIESDKEFTAQSIEQALTTSAEEMGFGVGKVLQAFRLGLSGEGFGPAIYEMTEMLGKEVVLRRLRKAKEILSVEKTAE